MVHIYRSASALRALVNSVSPSNDSEQNAERKVTDEQLLNLSTKLGEIFGDGQVSDGTNRNEKGEVGFIYSCDRQATYIGVLVGKRGRSTHR